MLGRVLNILGWVGTALVVAAVGVQQVRPDLSTVWRGLAIAGLVLVLVYLASQWREIGASFSRRQTRYGTLTLVSVLVVLGILVAVNYVAERQNKRWDLTASRQFSLSDQTTKILKSLKAPVLITVFDRDDAFRRWRDRLDEYSYQSSQVKVEYVDVDREPARTRQAQVHSYGTVVVDYQGRVERTTSDSEQDLTNALIKAVEGQQKKVYFVQGHGEKDTVSADERLGYNAIAQALGRDNFAVDKIVLAQAQEVPADASVLVVAGPTADFLQPELDMIARYLGTGGKLFLLVDPPSRADSAPLTNLVAFAKEWGVEVGNDVVLDLSPVGQLLGTGPEVPVAAPPYPVHPITDRFNLVSAFPLARSVTASSGGASGRVAQPFIETSRSSWAETDMKTLMGGGGEVKFDEGSADRRGPLAIAAAVSAPVTPAPAGEAKPGEPAAPVKETRVAVLGDSDFAANGFLSVPGNRDLFLNVVNWLAQQENLISIRPTEPEDRRVSLTASQQRLALLLSLLLVPGVVFLSGLLVWWRRR